jgi:hypothetical protein
MEVTMSGIWLDWDRVMSVRLAASKIMWRHVMKNMDKDQRAIIWMKELVKTGLDRSALYKGLNELESLGMIKPVGDGWRCVMVNPEVVRPAYIKEGKWLGRVVKSYEFCNTSGTNFQPETLKVANDVQENEEEEK